MSVDNASLYTVQHLSNPDIEAATLGSLAGSRPDLWPAILAHPHCYPELAHYIRERIGQNPSPIAPNTAPQWGGSGSAPQWGSPQPTAQQWAAPGPVPSPAQWGAPHVAAAPQWAAAPAWNYYARRPRTGGAPARIFGAVGAIIAILGLTSVFLPAVSGREYFGYRSYSYVDAAPGEAWFLFSTMLVSAIAAIIVSAVPRVASVVIAAVLMVVTGIVGVIDGFSTWSADTGPVNVDIGAGIVVLSISSVLLLVTAAILVITIVVGKRS